MNIAHSTAPANSLPVILNHREKQANEDYEWCLHDESVRTQFGGQVVAVLHKKIYGTGVDHGAAWRAACQRDDCPEKHEFTFVAVPHLYTER